MSTLLTGSFCASAQAQVARDAEGGPLDIMGDDRNSDPNMPSVGRGVTYFPRIYSDSRDGGMWKIIIHSAELDSPSAVIIYVLNDSPQLTTAMTIDVLVEVGEFDDTQNMILENRVITKDIVIEQGMNRIVAFIHNNKGDVVRVRLLSVRNETVIEPFSVTE